ncbi:hypothetical protein BB559_005226 [Furculomyces boomerangus]|uniref:Uncharacterized protein n=1 Tax=Furculomyces boomerangus TaxID=61424 RepID=A0A2T9Y9Y2_9FUNG|nr:hypothetical protein BB559_005226 [Furculomyces boomerangus]
MEETENSQIENESIFKLEPVEFSVTSELSSLSVENDTVKILSKDGRIQTIKLSEAHNIQEIKIPLKESEIESRPRLFTNHNAFHTLITFENGDNYYHFHGWKDPLLLNQLKGMVITAVGWSKIGPLNIDTQSTSGPILLGLNNGKIVEIELSGEDKSGRRALKYAVELYKLPINEAIMGLHFESFPGRPSQKVLFITTKTRMYQIIGEAMPSSTGKGPSNQPFFLSFFKRSGSRPSFLEIGGVNGTGLLSLFSKYYEYSDHTSANSFSWLTSNGVYFGNLSYGSQKAGDSVVESGNLIPYSDNSLDVASQVILTEFHIIMLINNKVKAISKLNCETVFDQDIPSDTKAISMVVDSVSRTCWILTRSNLIEIVIENEDRNVWKIMLEKSKFETSLQYCKTEEQKNIVYKAQADYYFDTNRYLLSAGSYAKSKATIEEIALKFMNKKDLDSLKTFLLEKLSSLQKKDLLQISLISTWIVELYLVNIGVFDEKIASGKSKNGDLNSFSKAALEEKKLLTDEFHSFLVTYNTYLHPKTVFELISGHGRGDSVLYYAMLQKDYTRIIDHYLSSSDYKSALEIMNIYGTPEIFYKYSPRVIRHLPVKLVDILLRQKGLNSSKLIPAFMEYEKGKNDSNSSISESESKSENSDGNQVMRYLEFAIYQMGDKSKALHNYYISLCVCQKNTSESQILRYLEFFHDNFISNLEFILSLCLKNNRVLSSTAVYTLLDYHEDAVDLALKKKDFSMAVDLTKRTNLIGIEDLIEYFPEFDSIDDFKQILCNTLEEYEHKVGNLYVDMDESMKNAALIQNEINNLNSRYAIIAENEPCQICYQPAIIKQIYIFPCQHVFHCDCLTRRVLLSSIRINVKKIKSLQNQAISIAKKRRELRLANIGGLLLGVSKGKNEHGGLISTNKSKTQSENRVEKEKELVAKELKIRKELDDMVARECVLCGEPNIKSVSIPLVDVEKDYDLMSTWII